MHPSAHTLQRLTDVLGLAQADIAASLGVAVGDVRDWVVDRAPDAYAERCNALADLVDHVSDVYGSHAPVVMLDEQPELGERSLRSVLVEQGPFAARDAARRLF